MPRELAYLWDWFLEIRDGKDLTYTELRSWSELTGTKLRVWEVELLRSLDRIARSVVNGQHRKSTDSSLRRGGKRR